MEAFFELERDEDNSFYCYESVNNICQPHFHSNLEIAYVYEGKLEVTIGGTTKQLLPGDLSIAESFEVHNYNTTEYSKIMLLLIPCAMVERFLQLTSHRMLSSPFLIQSKDTVEIKDAIEKLSAYNDTKDSLIATGYLYAILGRITEELGLTEYDKNRASMGAMRDVLFYIESHYPENITEEETARAFGYNKYYFSRLFNRTLGCGFLHYVNSIRARHAASLIHSTDLSLTEICYASGFQNARTFSRAFKSLYLISAKEYRDLCTMYKS